jgi:hypothetical protein
MKNNNTADFIRIFYTISQKNEKKHIGRINRKDHRILDINPQKMILFRIMNNRLIRAKAGRDTTTMMPEELCKSDTRDGR